VIEDGGGGGAGTCSTAMPAAPAAVHPPQVLKYSIPPCANCLAKWGVVTTAPMGKPFPMGLPSVTMSGTTLYLSNAQKWEPTRPKPTWTCSAPFPRQLGYWSELKFKYEGPKTFFKMLITKTGP